MPRERVQHGKLYVIEAANHTVAETLYGDPIPEITAHMMHEFIPGEVLKDGDVIQEEPSLDVNWTKDRHVQISIEAPIDWWQRFQESYAQEIEENPNRMHYAAFTETLTRAEINDMIRVLRRARDAVFGGDE